MKSLQRILIATFAIAALTAPAKLYRYMNSSGVVELSTILPQEYTKYGYEVLDSNMMVVEVVAPELSAAEFAKLQKQRDKIAARQREEKRVRTLYGKVADIDKAEEIKLHGIDEEIARGKADVARMRVERARLEEQAAARERAGNAPTGEVIKTIQALARADHRPRCADRDSGGFERTGAHGIRARSRDFQFDEVGPAGRFLSRLDPGAV